MNEKWSACDTSGSLHNSTPLQALRRHIYVSQPTQKRFPLRHNALGQVARTLFQPGGSQYFVARLRVFRVNEGLQSL
ncbi:MAG: hypothetical protein JXR43_03390, partial [Burkholderiaceae bacterium]|nr:hypothetical protein [Burkholderiaceae bacterium]